jgi:hypothetical protein
MSASSAGTRWTAKTLELVLKSLTREIDFLRAAGFVELVFDRAAACAEKQASLLGCHTLRVVDPMEFLTTMQRWTIGVLRQGQFRYAAATMRTFAGSTSSHVVINLFTVLGLKSLGAGILASSRIRMSSTVSHCGRGSMLQFRFHLG